MAVINSMGIVGRVVATSGSTASVLLANDTRNAIGAVTVRSRDFAIAEGVGDGTGVLKLKPLGDSPDLLPGDLVISSGLGGIYPAGHIIGEIVDVDEGAYGIAKSAYVRSSVDFNRIEEVLVLLESQKGAVK
jgi:rod shape-determining protein MreC